MINESNMEEIWKDIPGYEGYYQVSTQGRVKSLTRYTTAHTRKGTIIQRRYSGAIKRITKKQSGYTQVTLAKNGIHIRELVHILIAKTFIGNPNNKPEINHIDGDKTNNSISNLEWVTSSENQLHANRILFKQTGERHPASKFKNVDVLKIKEEYVTVKCYRRLAEKYQVHVSTIRRLVIGKTYRYAKVC